MIDYTRSLTRTATCRIIRPVSYINKEQHTECVYIYIYINHKNIIIFTSNFIVLNIFFTGPLKKHILANLTIFSRV